MTCSPPCQKLRMNFTNNVSPKWEISNKVTVNTCWQVSGLCFMFEVWLTCSVHQDEDLLSKWIRNLLFYTQYTPDQTLRPVEKMHLCTFCKKSDNEQISPVRPSRWPLLSNTANKRHGNKGSYFWRKQLSFKVAQGTQHSKFHEWEKNKNIDRLNNHATILAGQLRAC